MPKKKQPQHGGVRAGAGRKPTHAETKVTLSLRVTREVKEFLDAQKQSKGEFVDATVRALPEFEKYSAE